MAGVPAGFVQRFVTVNGNQYPYHPADESKHSNFPVGFCGCFGCGGDHSFANCSTKRQPECYSKFHWNLHCHKPEIYFKNEKKRGILKTAAGQPQSITPSPYGPQPPLQQSTVTFSDVAYLQPPPSSSQALGRGTQTTTPSWMLTRVPQLTSVNSSTIPPPPSLPPHPGDNCGDNCNTQDDNFAAEYVVFLDCFNTTKSNLRPMPITSQNELPHVKISLCEPGQGKCIGLSLLYDTGAALNT